MAMGIGMAALLAVVATVAVALFVRQMRLWYIMSHFPGPKAYPLIGCAYLFERDPREFFKMMMRWAVDFAFEYPDQKTMAVWVGPVPVIATGSAQDIEKILSSSRQLDKGLFYTMLTPWLGDGLLLSKGKKWHARRKLLTPSFHFAVLNSFVDIFNEKAKIFADKLDPLADGNPVNIFPLVGRCTLDIICGTAMGINIGAQEGSNAEYVYAILEMCDLLQERQKYPWLWPDVIYNRLPNGKKFRRHLEVLHNMTQSVIDEKLADKRHQIRMKLQDTANNSEDMNNNNGMMNGNTPSHDVIRDGSVTRKRKMAFLDLLLELHEEDETFSIDDVREEVDTFMFEGQDTTAAAISWALFMIGHHPNVQTKLQKELDDVFGADRERPVTSEDIPKLQYLGCVIKETLRLYPSVPLIGRQLEEDTTLNGHFVPKGTPFVVGIFMLHRDPDSFPDPDNFNPDNFLPENLDSRHPFCYLPFSAGPRNCIGQKFAVMEEKVVLATLLRKLSFKSLQSIDDVTPIGEIILRPYDDITMEIERRP